MLVVDVAKAGYGKTRQQIKAIAENAATDKVTTVYGEIFEQVSFSYNSNNQ